MNMSSVRIVKGHAESDELAALTAFLVARAAAHGRPVPRHDPSKAGWRRLERTPGFQAPHSWRS
ncbi:acyl-CoA carboxylase subunit epsilon [Streptomyces lancefieldiae]|uniref:Acyl-CoA carboxylase subunit epsilon n=1 Tax=Streptomyces lancefieldiae TaxID=3075520 RepID=A0ABU3AYY6_9ACTN|nr:acyl-CoA carboxylase subunit epsilon [Streptomyces sp. DSM 40712]MDT0615397.1 acyl-CoA carboxylase subunit epsilon [Streptomyces sp. DSM 40712]